MMFRSRRARILVVLAVLGIVVGAAAWYFLAPKPEEHRSDPAPQGTTLATGTFRDGEPLHHASGSIRLVEGADGTRVLRFEGFEATPGPDVYFYLTPKAHATTTDEVEGMGLKLRTPTAMGQATLRGDFNVELPRDADPAAYMGVALWCETYNVLFGYAELAR